MKYLLMMFWMLIVGSISIASEAAPRKINCSISNCQMAPYHTCIQYVGKSFAINNAYVKPSFIFVGSDSSLEGRMFWKSKKIGQEFLDGDQLIRTSFEDMTFAAMVRNNISSSTGELELGYFRDGAYTTQSRFEIRCNW